MSNQFLLPDLGEGLVEGDIVQWLVAVGDTVTLNQPLVEVETAKAIVELPSPYEGTVRSIHAQNGDTVAVGTPLITIASEESGIAVPADPSPENSQDEREPVLVGYGAPQASQDRPARRRRNTTRTAAASPASKAEATGNHRASLSNEGHAVPAQLPTRPRSTPPVRVYARQRGVDLESVSRSVHGRTVTRGDVDAFLAREMPGAAQNATATSGAAGTRGEIRIPVRGVRKQTAIAMEQSAFTAPQVTVFHTIDITETMSFLARLKRQSTSQPVGLLAVVSKAVCLALREVPEVNSSWDQESGEIVQYRHVDLGIAVATDRGLIVPHIRNAHVHKLEDLARELKDLATTGREGKTPLDRLSGGTFSITNIGVFGVDSGSPLLPPGQSGILAIGAVRKQPWEHEGEVKLRDVLTLSLTIDHRVIDGAEGARCLKAVGDLLVDPATALLHA